MPTTTCKEHSGLHQMATDVKEDTAKQWVEIDRIRNRPPVWCTAVIAVLSGLLGSAVTYAALVVKIFEST
jgi:hypothetical protein